MCLLWIQTLCHEKVIIAAFSACCQKFLIILLRRFSVFGSCKQNTKVNARISSALSLLIVILQIVISQLTLIPDSPFFRPERFISKNFSFQAATVVIMSVLSYARRSEIPRSVAQVCNSQILYSKSKFDSFLTTSLTPCLAYERLWFCDSKYEQRLSLQACGTLATLTSSYDQVFL